MFYVLSHSTTSHIQPRIFLFFLKNILKQFWKSFNTKFQPPWNDRKSSYKVKQNLKVFCYLIALILVSNSVTGLRVIKNVKEIKFEGVWDELQSKKGFQRE